MDNNTKFRTAANALALRWCNASDALDDQQTDEILKEWTRQNGGNEDLAVARMCELAYGLSNITLRDAFLIINAEAEKNGAALCSEGADKATIADVFDIIARHWHQFSEREKAIISSLVAGDPSDVKPTTTT